MNDSYWQDDEYPNQDDEITRQLCDFGETPFFTDYFEPDPELEHQYPVRAAEKFAASPQGKEAIREGESIHYVALFLELALRHRGETVEMISPRAMNDVLLHLFPAQVTMAEEDYAIVPRHLAAFFRFLEREYAMAWGSQLADEISVIKDEFFDAMRDSTLGGPAKQFMQMGREAGFDMTTPAGIEAFQKQYNEAMDALNRIDSPDQNPNQRPPSSVAGKGLKARKKLLAAKRKRP